MFRNVIANLRAFWAANVPWGVDHAALYSTDALRKTLSELVDFSIINTGSPRLTIGAANVETSMIRASPKIELAGERRRACVARCRWPRTTRGRRKCRSLDIERCSSETGALRRGNDIDR